MTASSAPTLRIALAVPIQGGLDYLPPPRCDVQALRPGMRLRVPFRTTTRTGLLLEVAEDSAIERHRLRSALSIIDDQPLVPAAHLELLQWAARYYHHPIGEVIAAVMPSYLRQGKPARMVKERYWRLSAEGLAIDDKDMARAPRQAALLRLLRGFSEGITAHELNRGSMRWRATMRTLVSKGWVEVDERLFSGSNQEYVTSSLLKPNPAQESAVTDICADFGRFQPFLLDGVTGSGKTEVYLQVVEQILTGGKQALVLVPEIGLTHQMIERFQQRFGPRVAVLHSRLTDTERLTAWLAARNGNAPIVIGTRSAVWTPMKKLGLIIVDEEHDASYKQQDGFRYSARDVAIVRGQAAQFPVVLGTATPSLESVFNTQARRYKRLTLPHRAGLATTPNIEILDVRGQTMHAGISAQLLTKIQLHLEQGHQILLFLNRRGYAPTILCHHCGWVAECLRCDTHMVYHRADGWLHCHHCGATQTLNRNCPTCAGGELLKLGQGTERVVELLKGRFPKARIIRVDRDTTSRKGATESLLKEINSGGADVLVGTQMLSKGHHFPRVTLAGIIDTDSRLYSVDFRAGERLAQLLVQVAGRAGRAEAPGTVVVQTHHPQHPLLCSLFRSGYATYAKSALEDRKAAKLPPYAALALIRAEAPKIEAPLRFLEDAMKQARPLSSPDTHVFGPIPAPMAKRAGHYRAQLILQSEKRGCLHRMLEAWLPSLDNLKSARGVRWSLDVDPYETF